MDWMNIAEMTLGTSAPASRPGRCSLDIAASAVRIRSANQGLPLRPRSAPYSRW
jgi:hypothetical protein